MGPNSMGPLGKIIVPKVDADMISTATAELGEVFDEDNIVPWEAASNTAADLTSRSTSPTTDNSAGNHIYSSISRPKTVATSEFFKSPGMFLIRLLLLLIMSGFPLDPGILDISYQPTESFPNILSHATFGLMPLPSGPTEFGSCFEKPGLPPI